MKTSLLLFLFVSTTTMWGQKVYTSSTTRHFPSAEIEALDRVISFDDEKITIKTVTGDDKVRIQTLFIKEKIINYDDDSTYLLYECTSRNRQTPTTVMIREGRPKYITMTEYSLKDPEKLLEYRLILDL